MTMAARILRVCDTANAASGRANRGSPSCFIDSGLGPKPAGRGHTCLGPRSAATPRGNCAQQGSNPRRGQRVAGGCSADPTRESAREVSGSRPARAPLAHAHAAPPSTRRDISPRDFLQVRQSPWSEPARGFEQLSTARCEGVRPGSTRVMTAAPPYSSARRDPVS